MKESIKVLSVNISKEKETIKIPLDEITLNHHGVMNDAHSGSRHRQVSLLGKESYDRLEEKAKKTIGFGEFAENITTEGIELFKTSPLDRFVGENVELEVSQTNKECKHNSAFGEIDSNMLVEEGIFARVIKQGSLKAGDILKYVPRILRFQVVTLSDRASKGESEDHSRPMIVEILQQYFQDRPRNIEVESTVIPADAANLSLIMEKSAYEEIDVLITTGGTGIGPRDITIETIKPMLDKEIPGIMEMIRIKHGAQDPNALINRGIAGVVSDTLVYTLPGSGKAIRGYMEEILKTLEYLIYMHHGLVIE